MATCSLSALAGVAVAVTSGSVESPNPNRQDAILEALMNESRSLAAAARPTDRKRRTGVWVMGTIALAAAATVGIVLAQGSGSERVGPTSLNATVATAATVTTVRSQPAPTVIDTTQDSVGPSVTEPSLVSTPTTVSVAPITTLAAEPTTTPVTEPTTTTPATAPTTTTPVTVPVATAPANTTPATVPALLQGVLAASELPANYSVFANGTMHNFGVVASREQADLVTDKFAAIVPVNDSFIIDPAGPSPTGIVYVPSGVLFARSSATVGPEFRSTLDLATGFMQFFPQVRMTIIGHTDNVGSDAANLDLSRRRAETAVQYMQGLGIAPARLTAVGRGESDPVASNDDPIGRSSNRRIEFVLEGLLD